MFRSRVLAEIETLDPIRDHQRIVYLSKCFDFPFDTTRALELALFRTYCVPAISALLDRTGEFAQRAQKRYDDTDLIVSILMERGYDSQEGRLALRRMNQIHGRFTIANDDFLYVLSTFVFEPLRYNDRFGWRRQTQKERLAFFHFWREVGLRMGIRDIPPELPALERFNREYEARCFAFAQTNRRVGSATRELFAAWFPRSLAPLVRRAIYALLDEPTAAAFGFPRPGAMVRGFVTGALVARATLVRWLPRRRRPVLRSARGNRTYRDGYEIERLGPS